MRKIIIHKLLTYAIAGVWLINGLFAKVLNLVPRHEQIVSNILGNDFAVLLTKAIGVAEILMAIWILSGIKSRLNAATQIVVVALMNALEFLLVPDLLLFGRINAVFALAFVSAVYFNEFVLKKDSAK